MKRNNKYLFPQKRLLVAKGNQNLATGSFAGTTANQVTPDDGQLMVTDSNLANAITAGDTISDVPAIKVVQGTPLSKNLSQVNPFGLTFPAVYESTILRGGRITMVSTTKPEVGRYHVQKWTITNTPVIDEDYRAHLVLQGPDYDRLYDKTRRHTITVTVRTPSTAVSDMKDFVYRNLGVDLLKESVWGGTNFNKFVVFGVGTGTPGDETTINTIADGSVIKVGIREDGTDINYTANKDFVQTLQDLVDAGTIAATDTIIPLKKSGAGTGDAYAVTALFVVGLDEEDYYIFDNTIARKVRIHFGADPEDVVTEVSAPKEWVGLGKHWDLIWKEQVGPRLFFNKVYGNYNEVAVNNLPSPVDLDQLYTSTIIEWVDEDERTSSSNKITHQLVILLPAQIDNPTATVADINGAPYTVSTTATNTVTDLNNTLGAWLESSHAVSPVTFVGEATATTQFV